VTVDPLSAMYGAAATWRRRWYATTATRARRLSRPVISIGNLRVGGTGKTPATACIARMLVERGERPVILSRGYARQKQSRGVTIVSNRHFVIAEAAASGDEPMLLARMLPGVPVLVCADRYRAGQLAEERFDPTVHLLDDGFQHVTLARDIDLLLIDQDDLDDRVLPAGRLREPIASASVAHAAIVPNVAPDVARAVADRAGVGEAFVLSRSLGPLVMLRDGDTPPVSGAPIFAVAGIARPERFLTDLTAAGWNVAGSMTFRDHHVFSSRDVGRIAAAAKAAGATAVVTTEKDAVRLADLDRGSIPFGAVPLVARIEPAADFAAWIAGRLERARAQQPRAAR
jgi:tetraacyldisaccharide 4'-kinase